MYIESIFLWMQIFNETFMKILFVPRFYLTTKANIHHLFCDIWSEIRRFEDDKPSEMTQPCLSHFQDHDSRMIHILEIPVSERLLNSKVEMRWIVHLAADRKSLGKMPTKFISLWLYYMKYQFKLLFSSAATEITLHTMN